MVQCADPEDLAGAREVVRRTPDASYCIELPVVSAHLCAAS